MERDEWKNLGLANVDGKADKPEVKSDVKGERLY